MKTSSSRFVQLVYCFIVSLILQFIAFHPANAQISITKSSLESIFQGEYEVISSHSEDSENIKSLYENIGADQVWDFTTISYAENFYTAGSLESSTNLEGAPLSDDPHFEQATHIVMSEFITDTLSFGLYSYQIFNENELIILGTVMTYEDETDPEFVTYMRPGDIEYQFPATFEDSWDFEYENEITFDGSSQTSDYSVNVEIEGWGKVVTEEAEWDVLRIKRTETTTMEGVEFSSIDVMFVKEDGMEVANISGEFDYMGNGIDEESLEASVNSFPEGTSTSDERISELPQRLKLDQNYPNPFNPSTQINYELPEISNVTLNIYSVTGEQVATLVNQTQSAGSYSIPFEASGLASGLYVYRLTADNQVLTRKMTLIK